jgi:hypothetical protein
MNKQLLSVLIFAGINSSIFAMEQETKAEKNISNEEISSAINNIMQELETLKQISEIKHSNTLFTLAQQYKNTPLQAVPTLVLQLDDSYKHLNTIPASTLSSEKKGTIWALTEKNKTIQNKFLNLLTEQKKIENDCLKNHIPMQFSITNDEVTPLIKEHHAFVIEYVALVSDMNKQ